MHTAVAACLALIASAVEPQPVARVGLTPGWATFSQVLGPGTAVESLRVGTLETQTDVKTRWPDGSICVAVVTTRVERAGTYPLYATRLRTGMLTAADHPAEVVLHLRDGTLFRASSSSADAQTSAWLTGPLVMEIRRTSIPRDATGRELSGVRVHFDQRYYHDGARRLAVIVENADDTPSNQPRHCRVQFLTGSVPDGPVDRWLWERDDLLIGSGTRFVRRFVWDLTESTVTPDFQPGFDCGALPRYSAAITAEIADPRGTSGKLRREFDVLGPGDLNSFMGAPGGRPEVAPYTDWSARYLVHRDARQAEYLQRMGDLAGSWPVHLREPSDGRMVSLRERPRFWFDQRGEDHMRGSGWGGSDLHPDNAHVPGGLALIPWLITGDRYYAEELGFWANYAVLSTWPGNADTDDSSRAGGDAVIGAGRGILATNQVRGFAWALRNIADAARFLPDTDPLRPEFRRIVSENLNWLDQWAATRTGPLGVAWLPGYGTETADGQRFAQLWMYDYLAWSIHRAGQLGFAGGTRFRDQIVRFQTLLFVSPEYHSGHAAPGRIVIGNMTATTDATRPFSSLKEVLEATSRQNEPDRFAGYYGVEARLALLIMMETDNSPDGRWRQSASAALEFLNDRRRHPGMWQDPLLRSGFGISGPDHP